MNMCAALCKAMHCVEIKLLYVYVHAVQQVFVCMCVRVCACVCVRRSVLVYCWMEASARVQAVPVFCVLNSRTTTTQSITIMHHMTSASIHSHCSSLIHLTNNERNRTKIPAFQPPCNQRKKNK